VDVKGAGVVKSVVQLSEGSYVKVLVRVSVHRHLLE
jgi:hypothetical protein